MNTIVIAPHPDDEVLGVGGTILRRKSEGAKVAWLIVTGMCSDEVWGRDRIEKRANEVQQISDLLSFDSVFQLNFPATQLDKISTNELVAAISSVFKAFQPQEIFVPHPSDIHSDHRITFDAVASCTKWFRYPSVKRILAYETLSETDFSLGVTQAFRPNVFINIESQLEGKLQAMDVYASELGDFPFPRSREAIRSLAAVRGVASGYEAAEAFELLRERL